MITLVAGLPGSGKTRWLAAHEAAGALIFDDFKAHSQNNDSRFECSQHIPALLDCVKADRDCFIADIDFCRTEARLEADAYLQERFPGCPRWWVVFENAPDQCRRNVQADGHRNTANWLAAIDRFSPEYLIPANATVLPVWSPSGDAGG